MTERPRTTPGSILFGVVVGLLAALLAYRWITDPNRQEQRLIEASVVGSARTQLLFVLERPIGQIDIVDPQAPDRKVGKSYVYPVDGGWEVSGHYRRGNDGRWYPFLMRLDREEAMVALRLDGEDARIPARAADDPRIEILR